MRKSFIPITFFATVMLGGCTTLGGFGDVFDDDNYGNSDFERAAANACGREASRYGRVRIDRVEQNSRDTVQVRGRIDTRDKRRDEFGCTFRSNGRIVDFRRF